MLSANYFLLMALLLAGCRAGDRERPPLSTTPDALHPGDVVVFAGYGEDPLVRGRATIDAASEIDAAPCGRVKIGGLGEKAAADAISQACLRAEIYGSGRAVRIGVLSRAPVVVAIASGTRKREMTWHPGLKLVEVVLASFPEHTNYPYRVSVLRGGREYIVDLEAIANGDAADVELQPGDQVIVPDSLPFRAPETRATEPVLAPPTEPTLTCGEARLAEIAATARGMGPRHPRVRKLQAMLAQCTEEATAAELRTLCPALSRQHAMLRAEGKGPRHPDVLAIEAQLQACPPP